MGDNNIGQRLKSVTDGWFVAYHKDNIYKRLKLFVCVRLDRK